MDSDCNGVITEDELWRFVRAVGDPDVSISDLPEDDPSRAMIGKTVDEVADQLKDLVPEEQIDSLYDSFVGGPNSCDSMLVAIINKVERCT